MEQPVILGAVRTPIGKFQGGLSSFAATDLGAKAAAEAVRRGLAPPARGCPYALFRVRCDGDRLPPMRALRRNLLRPRGRRVAAVAGLAVVTVGLGQNPARQAGLRGGLHHRVAAMTINKVCGSGLKAVGLAAQGIQLGEIEIAVAGGMESMSNCPYLLPQARTGYRLGHGQILDAMIADGLWDVYEDFHMGLTAELVAEKYKISRQEQDQFALESHQKAVRATKSCFFESQILPIEVPQKKGAPLVIKYDESPREDSSLEALAKLRPAFKKDGTVTAGNAPGTNDGAAAVVVTSERNAARLGKTPMARILAQAVSGIEPKWVMMAPVEAVEKLLRKVGWDRDRDVDLFELNEAFAVQALAVMRAIEDAVCMRDDYPVVAEVTK